MPFQKCAPWRIVLHFFLPKICTLVSPLLRGAEFTLSVAKHVALFERVRVLRFASVKWRNRGSKHETKYRISCCTALLLIEKMKQINTKNYRKKRVCVRLRLGDKLQLRKSADRKAEIRKTFSVRSPDWILCFSICRFSQVVFIPRAQPNAHSLFLFPIVFGISGVTFKHAHSRPGAKTNREWLLTSIDYMESEPCSSNKHVALNAIMTGWFIEDFKTIAQTCSGENSGITCKDKPTCLTTNLTAAKCGGKKRSGCPKSLVARKKSQTSMEMVLLFLSWLPTDDGVEHRNVLKSKLLPLPPDLSNHQ